MEIFHNMIAKTGPLHHMPISLEIHQIKKLTRTSMSSIEMGSAMWSQR